MRIDRPDLVRLALGGLLALGVSQGIGRFVYTPILPLMVQDLGLTGREAGSIASANFVGYLLGAIFTSLPGIPGSRRAWMLGGLALSTATTALVALGTGVPVLAAIRLVGGFASALAIVYASALVLDRLNAGGRGELSAVHFAGVGFGIAGSSALVAALVALGFGWRDLWLALALLSAAGLAAVSLLIPSPPPPAPGPVAAPAGRTRMSGALLRMVAAYGLFGIGYVVTATFLVAIVRADPASSWLTPWIWPLTGLVSMPSGLVWNGIARRIGPYRGYALNSVTMAVGVAASVVVPGPIGAILAAIMLGGTFMGTTALGFVGARNLSDSDPRRIIGAMTAVFGIGQIVGPFMAGSLFDLTGSFRLASLIAATSLLVGAALTWTIPERKSPLSSSAPR